jgi:CheY-like chemotaxis protein
VKVDSGQFEAALLNLAINARDAMPGGGTLTISLRAPQDRFLEQTEAGRPADAYIQVVVKDTGSGMSQDVLARAFEPFFTTKDVGKGSGLGLSMVYGFVRQSGGRIEIESEPGQGTAVNLFFQRAAAPTPTAEAKTIPMIHFKSLRVLLVEDEPEVREIVRAMLSDLGAVVTPAADGPTALDILKSDRSIDIIITDLVMPGGIDGIALAEHANAMRPGMKIVFMSGNAELDHETALAINGRPFLTKPFRILDLGAALLALQS